jgi:hypothetical protein
MALVLKFSYSVLLAVSIIRVMIAASIFEISVNFCQSTRRYNPEAELRT